MSDLRSVAGGAVQRAICSRVIAVFLLLMWQGAFAVDVLVTTYGARCDGLARDEIAIQKAIDSISFGDTLVIPGTCLAVSSIALKSGTKIRGVGSSSKLVFSMLGETDPEAIKINGVSGVSIANLGIEGGTDKTLSRAIGISQSDNILLDRLTFRKIALGKYGSVHPQAAISINNSSDITISNSIFTSNGALGVNYFEIEAGGNCTAPNYRIRIIGNTIKESNSNIVFYLLNTRDSAVIGNDIDASNAYAGGDNNGYGVAFYTTKNWNSNQSDMACANIVVKDNLIKNTAGSGIYLQGVWGAAVENNYLYNVANIQLRKSLVVAAIAIAGGNPAALYSSDISIVGNCISGSGYAGIALANTSGVFVGGNTIQNLSTNLNNPRSSQASYIELAGSHNFNYTLGLNNFMPEKYFESCFGGFLRASSR